MEEEKKVTTIDELLPYIGELGIFQLGVITIFCLMTIPISCQSTSTYFLVDNPSWECVGNSSLCSFQGEQFSGTENYNKRCKMPRSEWKYTKDNKYSIATEFDLGCTEYWIHLTTSMLFIGTVPGFIFIGWISDRFGRVKTLIPCVCLLIIVPFLSAFSKNFFLFLASRFVIGFAMSGSNNLFFVVLSELVGPKYRPGTGITLWIFYTLSLIVIGVLAMFVKTWKMLLIYITAPFAVLLPLLFVVPESLRFLYVKGHEKKLKKIIKKIARFNGKSVPPLDLSSIETFSEESNGNFLTLFKTKKMLKLSLTLAFVWFVNGMVYFGITLASDQLSDDMYWNYILSSLVEFPSAICGIFGAMKFGRKKIVQIPLLLSGIFCIGVVTVIEEQSQTSLGMLRVTFGLCGKFCITLAFDVLYTWTTELYPTVIRNQGYNMCLIMSSLGGMLAPWISDWLLKFGWWLPFSVMGILGIVAAISLQPLPETKDKATQEFLENNKSSVVKKCEIVVDSNEIQQTNM